MNLLALAASFGGGTIGAYMGALPASILTGVIAIAGSAVTAAGGTDITVGLTALDSYLGPHTIFAGGVAVSTYADRTRKLDSGTDILSCLDGPADPATLLVGSVFGVIGFLIHYLTEMVLHLNIDLPGFTVILSAVIARLVLGSGGLIEKAAPGESREYFTSGREMLCNVILGPGLGAAAGFVYQVLLDGGASAVVIGSYLVSYFGIAAVSLIFAQTGFAMPVAHYIALIPVLAAVSSQNPVMGTVLGIPTTLFGDSIGKTFNSCRDIYIDPPAFTIFVFTLIVSIMSGNGFFSI